MDRCAVFTGQRYKLVACEGGVFVVRPLGRRYAWASVAGVCTCTPHLHLQPNINQH
jgi:hypothetical protein